MAFDAQLDSRVYSIHRQLSSKCLAILRFDFAKPTKSISFRWSHACSRKEYTAWRGYQMQIQNHSVITPAFPLDTLQITLIISDPEIITELQKYSDPLERDTYALAALRIGI